jgi:3-phytase
MTNSIQLNHIGTVKLSGAEISDFDPKTQRLFVTGSAGGQPILQVIDACDPKNLIKINEINLSSLGAGIQSVAVRKATGTENSIVAVAISGNNITDPGKVAFYDAFTLTKISEVTVGALPDMITFTPDGSKLLVANEGEPSGDYTIDPEGSISIIDVSGDIASLDNTKVTTATFTAFNGQEAALKAAGVRIFGPNATVAQDLEPEYIAVSPDGKTAFITLQENNAIAILDIDSGTITNVEPLGYKDHSLPGNGLDTSDRDGGINIQNWPVFGMYQPDGIASFQVGDKTYYITANEGDARDYAGFAEEIRVSNTNYNLDDTIFTTETTLKQNANLGRLTVTKATGDIDNDGDFDQIQVFGGRSFSIWDDEGKLVFDSGDQLEQITAQKTPTLFNANDGLTDERDARSDNKGPEPESVVVGVIDGVTYGFIGLERAGGGVMVYNLSDPNAPEFVQYIRTPGDVSPEGIKFISAEDSPSNKPLLAVSHEVSNNVSFYEITPPPNLTAYEFQNLPLLGTTSAGQDILLGGFSGLYFQGIAENGNLKFVTHTDRGPNGEPTGQNRPFLLPDFQPEIVSFELNQTTSEITITNRTKLFRADGTTPLTGLPNLQAGAGGTAYTDEIGVNLNGEVLPNDPFGADLEGIVVAPNGDFWMVDEYRPAIYHFDADGKLIDRFIPQGTATAASQPEGTFGTEVLPVVYAQRRNNRGFEAVALEGNKLYAFIQSAIDNPDVSNDATSRNSRNLRILEFDVVTKQVTGEYLYLLDDITGTNNAKTDKIGDAVSLGNSKFAVVERDDLSNENSNKLIYKIDLAGATNINNPANFTLPAGKTIEQLTEAELTAAGITVVSKDLIVNAAEIGYTGVEKLEGLALVDRDTLAVINDNDFQVTGTPIPEKLGIIKLPQNIVAQYGTDGDDELFADNDDSLIGGLGNDSLYAQGSSGNNYLEGGEDNDLLVVVEGDNNKLDGGAGKDLLFVSEGNQNKLIGDDGDDELYIMEGGFNTLKGGAGNDYLKTSSTSGNNTLEGGAGDDILIGYLASDRLFGDAGNDSLYAGKQGTQMTGGAGLDTFYLGNGYIPDVPAEILDFTKGDDQVIIAGITQVQSFADIILEQDGDDTFIKALIDGSEKVLGILRNTQANTLTADDFGFIVPVFSITNAEAFEGNAIIFTITRTDDILADQTITVTTSIADGDTASETDFIANTQVLTFAQGDTEKTFTVETNNDNLFEGNETFTVTLNNPTNGAVISSTNATAKGTITDDDPAPIFSIAAAEATEGNDLVFTITRTGDAQAEQSVTVATSIADDDTASETDFIANSQIFTFAQGETSKTFTVETTDDFRIEENESFTVSLTDATNGATISSTNATAKGTINDDDIPLAVVTNSNVFTIKGFGSTVRLKATLVSSSSSVVNELGVFVVDDEQGSIEGIKPGEQGYNEVALARVRIQGKSIFSAIANLPNLFKSEIETNNLTRLLGFDSGSHLKFFLVRGGTIDAFRGGSIASTNIVFAESSTQIITQQEGSFSISWKESTTITEFNSLVVKVESTEESLTIGTALQGENGNPPELIDFRGIAGTVKADFSVYREAAFNNEVYFYQVDNPQGTIGNLSATAANRANYLQAAINNLITDVNSGEAIKFAVSNQGKFTDSALIAGGSILAPMIIVNGTLSQLLDNNTGNDPQVYFPYLGLNNGVDHIRLLGDNTFGFEDLPGGGDADYNDVMIKFNFSIA